MRKSIKNLMGKSMLFSMLFSIALGAVIWGLGMYIGLMPNNILENVVVCLCGSISMGFISYYALRPQNVKKGN